MTDEVKFDTGVMPPLGTAGIEQAFRLNDMQPGNSFFHPCDDKFAHKLASAVRTYAKKVDRKFTTKRLSAGDAYGGDEVLEAGLAVWRI